VQKAQRELQRVLDLPAVKERYATLGLEPLRGGPTELADLVRRDGQKWSAFLRERGIRSTD
jgi:tripartite-type tricarboxylate transporter receptor subunit TctC